MGIMAYAALLFSWLVGLALLPPRLRSGRLPLAFGAGVFAISLQMLGYDLIGLPWNRWSLLLPWLVVIGLRVYRTGARRLLPEVPPSYCCGSFARESGKLPIRRRQ